jgi:membrane-associated protease RseP (regulator of RpoE activity)
MQPLRTALTALLCLAAAAPFARPADPPAPDSDKAAYLGVLFGPVPEALYDQLPQLPRDGGVLVTQVLSDSPAAKAGLRRNDVLLRYDGKPIKDCDDLVRRLQADRPERVVKLAVVHGGQETTVEAALAVGPAIRTAEPTPPGVAKPYGAPAPSLSVAATPLERGRLKVTIEYYPDGPAGKLKTVTCEAAQEEIAAKVADQLAKEEQLKERERNVAQEVLKRILGQVQSAPPAEKAPADKP